MIDDDARLASMVCDYLGRAGFDVETAGSLASGREHLAANVYEALILDLMLPDGDGLELCRELRSSQRTRQLPLLMLTARGEPTDRIVGLELGADDYLGKPFEPYELVLRLRAMLRRVPTPEPAVPTGPVRLGRLSFDLARAELSGPDGVVHLTGGEAALLLALATRPGDVLSREWIAEHLGRDRPEEDAGERAIDVQVTRLRRKIEADPREPRFLHTVRGRGYVLKPGV